MVPSAPAVAFDSESFHVITGALSGLGQSLIQWMVDRGVRHLVFVSKRDLIAVAGAQELVDSLASRDVHAEYFDCDVSKKNQVMRMIQQITWRLPETLCGARFLGVRYSGAASVLVHGFDDSKELRALICFFFCCAQQQDGSAASGYASCHGT